MTTQWISCIDHPDYIAIAKILAKNKIIGASYFYIQTEEDKNANLTLACTRYGNSFVYYKVSLLKETAILISGRDRVPPYENLVS